MIVYSHQMPHEYYGDADDLADLIAASAKSVSDRSNVVPIRKTDSVLTQTGSDGR